MNCEKTIFLRKVSVPSEEKKESFNNQLIAINNYKNSHFVNKKFA